MRAHFRSCCIILVSLLLMMLVGCSSPVVKKSSKQTETQPSEVGMLDFQGENPADWGYKKFATIDEAMADVGFSFKLPKETFGAKFEAAYTGTDTSGQPTIGIWYDKMILSCTLMQIAGIDYNARVKEINNMNTSGKVAEPKKQPRAIEINGKPGMIWPQKKELKDKVEVPMGPGDIYWSDGKLAFEIVGRNAGFGDTEVLEVAKSI